MTSKSEFDPHECEVCGTDCNSVEFVMDMLTDQLNAAKTALAEAQRERDALIAPVKEGQRRIEIHAMHEGVKYVSTRIVGTLDEWKAVAPRVFSLAAMNLDAAIAEGRGK